MGADPVGPISTQIGKVVGVHDVIIHSNFGFNIFRGFTSAEGQILRFSIDNNNSLIYKAQLYGCL